MIYDLFNHIQPTSTHQNLDILLLLNVETLTQRLLSPSERTACCIIEAMPPWDLQRTPHRACCSRGWNGHLIPATVRRHGLISQEILLQKPRCVCSEKPDQQQVLPRFSSQDQPFPQKHGWFSHIFTISEDMKVIASEVAVSYQVLHGFVYSWREHGGSREVLPSGICPSADFHHGCCFTRQVRSKGPMFNMGK